MYAKNKFIKTLQLLGCYDVRLCSHTDYLGRRYYSGFITKPDTGLTVYLSAESFYNPHCDNKFLVRYAKEIGDYRGGVNRYTAPENSPFMVHTLLSSPNLYKRELS